MEVSGSSALAAGHGRKPAAVLGPATPGAPTRQVLADHVHDALLDLLMDGHLAAGETVAIDVIARRFDVSPTPVREALARLEHTGLVRRAAMRGYRVAPVPTPAELSRLMDARLLIEPALAEVAARNLDEDSLRALSDAVRDLSLAPLGPSFHEYRTYWQADERFHRQVAAATGNEFLSAAYSALGGHIQRFRLFADRGVSDSEHCIAEHTRVLQALRTRDGPKARHAMATHIADARDRALASYAPITEEDT